MLIIDEISMVDADLFDKLDYVARVVRGKDSPFGGVQLVCCGDFFQVQASRHPPRMLRPLSLSLLSISTQVVGAHHLGSCGVCGVVY